MSQISYTDRISGGYLNPRFLIKNGVIRIKSRREYLYFKTKERVEFINITGEVEGIVNKSGINQGLCLVNAMHITASVFINDDEPGLHNDYKNWLEELAPHEPISRYQHNTFETNGDAHLKRQVMGREVVVAITDGELDFGPWEQIFYGEFDGKREKRVLVKVIGE
ncbi:MAG TPA: secondary thiamine-phosphate synthase enzyme YjbQ [Halanaerobiales bacterium]|nr:secondary thiamine-phosphate synthase enzyme YjbQ [Halanaerobiales bacterium]